MKFTRKQYLNKECSHNEYYGQFVSPGLVDMVSCMIGEGRIKRSSDPHFNDIPLRDWDSLNGLIREYCGRSIAEANGTGGISLSDTVSVAKAAARQIKEDLKS